MSVSFHWLYRNPRAKEQRNVLHPPDIASQGLEDQLPVPQFCLPGQNMRAHGPPLNGVDRFGHYPLPARLRVEVFPLHPPVPPSDAQPRIATSFPTPLLVHAHHGILNHKDRSFAKATARLLPPSLGRSATHVSLFRAAGSIRPPESETTSSTHSRANLVTPASP